MVSAAGRERRIVKWGQGTMNRETRTFFLSRIVAKKSHNRDNTLKSSVEFHKLSPQSGIERRGVESRDHTEVKG